MPNDEIRIEDATISLDYLYDCLAEQENDEKDIRCPEEYYGF